MLAGVFGPSSSMRSIRWPARRSICSISSSFGSRPTLLPQARAASNPSSRMVYSNDWYSALAVSEWLALYLQIFDFGPEREEDAVIDDKTAPAPREGVPRQSLVTAATPTCNARC
jgi:hypothetical protein